MQAIRGGAALKADTASEPVAPLYNGNGERSGLRTPEGYPLGEEQNGRNPQKNEQKLSAEFLVDVFLCGNAQEDSKTGTGQRTGDIKKDR